MNNSIEERYAYEILVSMKYIPFRTIKKDRIRLICRIPPSPSPPPSPLPQQHYIDSSNDFFICVNYEQYGIVCLNHGGEGRLLKNFIVEKKKDVKEYKIQLKRHLNGKIIEDFCDEDFSQVQPAKKKRKSLGNGSV